MGSPFISNGALKLLREMHAAEKAECYEDAEIVCDGLSCWLGNRQTTRRTVTQLLRVCVVSDVSDAGKGADRYVLNEDGRAIAEDDQHVPLLVRQMRLEWASRAAAQMRRRGIIERPRDPKNPMKVGRFSIGDVVVSMPAGMGGVVLKVLTHPSGRQYRVVWENGHTGVISPLCLLRAQFEETPGSNITGSAAQ